MSCRFHVGPHSGTFETLVSPLNARERPCASISSEDDRLSTLKGFLDSPEEVVSIGVAAHNRARIRPTKSTWIRRFYRAFAILGVKADAS
jgi:hypothetical protein